ncbi:hypothetical protein [Streptomyces sp. NPDC094458]|uniref:hypothetical protein n=1 Tax=Streptomyces sp. NPDC094458 TaxID=3155208 RepID=UPI003330555B
MTRLLFLLDPRVFRLIWVPLITAECVAQFVFHRQDVTTVLAAVLLAVIVTRWALDRTYEICPADCAKCAEDGETA